VTTSATPPRAAAVGATAIPTDVATARGGIGLGLSRSLDYAGLLPFALFVGLFLLWPTAIVVVGAFQDPEDGSPTLANLAQAAQGTYLETFVMSTVLSAITAVLGAVLGGLLAWAISIGRRDGVLRRLVLAGSGTLAQFGGVMLAFAFLATFGFNGLVTLFLHDRLGVDTFAWGGWIYEMPGLVLVYTYFQIPLMVIVFLPALDGLRPQWREACESLGGSAWSYWRLVGFPILWPSFLGATLLLFANAFSAYATAKALISQASPLVPLRIGTFLTSEVVLGQANLGKALAFGMILVVAATMTVYALLQRRTSRWLR
jgi:putative spermidine/putrescine transport system permease protein